MSAKATAEAGTCPKDFHALVPVGFNGDVIYGVSDAEYAYFRLGGAFRSCNKLPTFAVSLPETLSLEAGRSYVVGFHIQEDKTIRIDGACKNYAATCLATWIT